MSIILTLHEMLNFYTFKNMECSLSSSSVVCSVAALLLLWVGLGAEWRQRGNGEMSEPPFGDLDAVRKLGAFRDFRNISWMAWHGGWAEGDMYALQNLRWVHKMIRIWWNKWLWQRQIGSYYLSEGTNLNLTNIQRGRLSEWFSLHRFDIRQNQKAC